MVPGKKKLLSRALALTLATGVFSYFNGAAEAGEIVNIDSVVMDTVYGNGGGENNTIQPIYSGYSSDLIGGYEINIFQDGAVQSVFGAYRGADSPSFDYDLLGNVINVNNGYVGNKIIGAYNESGHGYGKALYNRIILNDANGSSISEIKAAHIYGGGTASSNEILIRNTDISNTDSEIIGAIINPDAKKEDGSISANASDNSVRIYNTDVGKIEGGNIDIPYYNSNSSSIPKTDIIDVTANNNKVDLFNSSVSSVIGGHIQSSGLESVVADRKFFSVAEGNYITIKDTFVKGNILTSTGVVGGLITVNDGSILATGATNTLSADGNNINIADSTINCSLAGGKVFTNPFSVSSGTSGEVNMHSSVNRVSILGNTIINSELLGGDVSANITGNRNGDIREVSAGNIVEISDGTVNSDIFGGRCTISDSIGNVSSNDVEIIVNNNIVEIGGGNIANSVFGGQVQERFYSTDNDLDVCLIGNTVEINGGHINGSIVSGQFLRTNNSDNSKYTVKNNNVIWRDGIIDGSIIGDDILRDGISSWNADDTNSSFNFYASALNSNKTIAGISNFKNYNFYIDNTVAPDSTLITVNNTVDMSKSNIGVAMTSDAALNLGDSIKLLSTQGLITQENLENYLSSSGLGRAGGENIYDVYDFALGNDGYNLTATVENRSSNPKSEEIPESRQPEVTVVDDKLDIVDTAYNMSIGVVEPVSFYDMNHTNVTKGNMTMRSNDMVIGSTSTKGDEEKNNTITQGPFFEYGTGSFIGKNFYSTGGVEGSGSSKKYGIGYLLREVKFGRHHFDAYVRTGRISNEFRSYMTGVGSVNYNNTDTYYAAHFGYGQYLPIAPNTKMDVYGKYFYKIIPGSSTTTHINNTDTIKTEFEPIVSHKFRIGSKVTWDYMEEKKKMMFADLALEHELSHTQTTILGDREISNSSGADTTGVLELGYRQVFGPKDAFLFTADLQGYAGTRTGFGGNIGVRFNF